MLQTTFWMGHGWKRIQHVTLSHRHRWNEYTSVCLIYFPESTADSKKSLGDMNIPNTVSKSFNCPPIILKFFRSEISIVIEISVDFNLLGTVEFQIYHFILPILQANLGKIPFKTCNIQKSHSKSKNII